MGKRQVLLALCAVAILGLLSGCTAPNNSSGSRTATERSTRNQAKKEAFNPATKDSVPQTSTTTLVPVTPGVVEHGPRDSKMVALTFDLCEAERDHAGFDEKVINILMQKGAKATFFMGGKWAETHPDSARMLSKNALFEIENHSYSHKVFTRISEEEANRQVVKAQESINQATGKIPRYFRFPAGKYNQWDLKLLADRGLTAIQWDVVTGDPDPHVSAADIIRVVKQKAHGGSIIIMHANGRGWHTAEALPQVIDYLRGSGYRLVTISELLKD